MPRRWPFDSLFCPEGRGFVHNDCLGERVFAPFKSCPEGGMVLDEIDACITDLIISYFRFISLGFKRAISFNFSSLCSLFFDLITLL